jgi:hypothetical protein
MWKAPGEQEDRRWAVSPEKDRQYAYDTLVQAQWTPKVGETALWESIWRDCDNDQMRFIALKPICADPDPSIQPIIVEVLNHPDLDAYPSSISRCLSGLVHRDTEETVDAILGAWDVLSSEHGKWVPQALGALSTNSRAKARRVMYEFILDDEQPESRRAEALAKLGNQPFPDDSDTLRRFLESTVSTRQKSDVLRWLKKWPVDYVRPVLRDTLGNGMTLT